MIYIKISIRIVNKINKINLDDKNSDRRRHWGRSDLKVIILLYIYIYIFRWGYHHLIKIYTGKKAVWVDFFLTLSSDFLFVHTRKMLCYGCHHESSGNNHHHSETVFNCMCFSECTKSEREKYPLNPFAHSGSISLYLFLRQFSLSLVLIKRWATSMSVRFF